MAGQAWTVGLDVGGTKVLGGLVAEDGQVAATLRRDTPVGEGAAGILATMAAVTRELMAGSSGPVQGVGVSTAGHVEAGTGTVIDGTPNLPGWAGTPVAAWLSEAVGLPVCADNDANAAAWAEAWCGAGKGLRTVVAVTLGTGFGGGVVDAGHVLRGARGGGAELGHMILVPDGRACNCGRFGCVEAYLSGTALGREAARLWGADADAHVLFARAEAGDRLALQVLETFSAQLASVMVSLTSLFDPDVILIGGGLSRQGEAYLPRMRARMDLMLAGRRWSSDLVRLAALGEAAGFIGAAGQAWQHFGTRR